MPIVNDKTQEDAVLKEFIEKVSLETAFESDLRDLFKEMVAVAREELGVKKKAINFDMFFGYQMMELMDKNYRRAIGEASGLFTTDPIVQRYISEDRIQLIRTNTVNNMMLYSKQRSKWVSDAIMETTKKNYDSSFTFVERLAQAEGLSLTQNEINSLAMEKFEDITLSRTETISRTEIQDVYERTKQVEGSYTSEEFARQGLNMQKRWDATLDSYTRPAHAQAHGQRVNTNDVFIVDGESLQYPGDTSFGASLGNVINCRCSSQFIVLQLD